MDGWTPGVFKLKSSSSTWREWATVFLFVAAGASEIPTLMKGGDKVSMLPLVLGGMGVAYAGVLLWQMRARRRAGETRQDSQGFQGSQRSQDSQSSQDSRASQDSQVSKVSLAFDDESITTRFADGTRKTVHWAELTKVVIVTTDEGPFVDDVFWRLYAGDDVKVAYPQIVEGSGPLLDAMQERLEGFDNEAVITAMGSTDNARFTVWERRPGATEGA